MIIHVWWPFLEDEYSCMGGVIFNWWIFMFWWPLWVDEYSCFGGHCELMNIDVCWPLLVDGTHVCCHCKLMNIHVLCCRDEYFCMKAQWKTITPQQEARFATIRERKSIIGMSIKGTQCLDILGNWWCCLSVHPFHSLSVSWLVYMCICLFWCYFLCPF